LDSGLNPSHALLKPNAVLTRRSAVIGAAGALLAGCHSQSRKPGPSIEFTRIPQADGNGRDKHDIIEGKVTGAQPGQQIVLYSKSGDWWLQPLVSNPFTKILKDSKWRNATHLGTDYAALVVDPGYRPPPSTGTLPATTGLVAAIAVTKGAKTAPSASLQFSGYEWRVRDAPSNRGGRNNAYSPENAWVDKLGAMHLRIKNLAAKWTCAEVTLTRSFGYGTYSFVVHDASQLPPDVVLEMFTWDYSGSDSNNREMDIEVRPQHLRSADNARFVVQPYHVATNVFGFKAPPGPLKYTFHWEPGRVSFSASVNGKRSHPVSEHVFTLGIPAPGVESARMALYLASSAGSSPAEAEVVIDSFEYLP
jgi:hypothetical protein